MKKSVWLDHKNSSERAQDICTWHERMIDSLLLFFIVEVGDFVAQDEEIATIETDKVDVTVNSPASGTIVELYAQEEDNVAVGGDFFKLELGDAPKEGIYKKEWW